jgi:hypothetical protein
VVSV